MKKLLMIAALLPVAASAQTGKFTITGKIGNLDKPAKVYFDYMDSNGAGKEDSAVVVNGTFKFTGNLTGIGNTRMSLDHTGEGKPHSIYAPGADVIYFYFGKENIVINSKDSLSNARFTGSKVYDDFQAYNKQIGGTIMDLTKAANNAYSKATPEQQKDSIFMAGLNASFRKSIDARSEKQYQFAKSNPKSYFALVGLSEAAGSKVDVKKIQPVFTALDPKLKQLDMGKELQQRIEAAGLTSIGSVAPTFTQNDVNGKPVSLADFKGKVVLVEFWASWCVPCRAENPNLVEQYKKYKDKGFEILSVSLDNSKAAWLAAIEKDGLPWAQVSDLKGWNNAVGRLYGVRAVPQSFLVDRDGKVIGNTLRGETLNKKLAELMN